MPELLKVADCYKYPMPWVLSKNKGGEWENTSPAWVEDYEVLRDYLRYSVNDTINLLQQHQDRLEALEKEKDNLHEIINFQTQNVMDLLARIERLEAKEIPDATTES